MRIVKIFVLGAGPLPESGKIANAGGLRTAQFLEKITSTEGVSGVELLTIENGEMINEKPVIQKIKNVEVRQRVVAKNDARLFRKAKEMIVDYAPDAIFGVNVFPAFVAAKCAPEKTPLWADLNGWIVAERQIQAVSSGKNDFVADAWEKERDVLLRSDFLSVVSTPQKYATIGEMAALGFLTKEHVEMHVEVVENACRPLSEEEKKKDRHFQYRGKLFPEEAFVFLWTGGMNAWADEKTLFLGLEKAMTQNPNVHFVMTGESLVGIDEAQFPAFRKRAEQSPFRANFHFLGWVETEKMPALFWECNAGINVDRWCPETEFGARNRLNEFLRFGLPIISTEGSEIAEKISEKNAGVKVKSGDIENLANALHRMTQGGDFLETMRYNGAKLAEDDFSLAKTTTPIEKFLKNPERIRKIPAKGNVLTAGREYLKSRGARAFLKKCRQKISEKIGW